MITELETYWTAQSRALAQYFGFAPKVFGDGHTSFGFFLGNFEVFNATSRNGYTSIVYSEWDSERFKKKNQNDRTSKTLQEAVELFCPQALDNIEANKQAIMKNFKANG